MFAPLAGRSTQIVNTRSFTAVPASAPPLFPGTMLWSVALRPRSSPISSPILPEPVMQMSPCPWAPYLSHLARKQGTAASARSPCLG